MGLGKSCELSCGSISPAISQGPAFVPSGIYKPAYLVTLEKTTVGTNTHTSTPPVSPSEDVASGPVFIEESSIDIYKTGQSFSVSPKENADWIVNVTLALRSAQSFDQPTMTLSIPELRLTSKAFRLPPIKAITASPSWVQVAWTIPDRIPQRWYPHNLGTPKLYNLTATIHLSQATAHSPANTLSFMTTTGFRTIELVQSPYSQQDVEKRGITPGDNWHFNINGKAFYSLGTNIIPFDPFYARTTTDQVRWVLESAVKSGQNMVCSTLSRPIDHRTDYKA